MVLFPHAKINLGLQIIAKRRDGFHDIISCLYPISWCDVLEILEMPDLAFTTSGLNIPGDPNDNLCLKAYHLIKDKFDIPLVHIHLHKVVPIGAGLGGGSSDAAYTLRGLRQKFDLPLSDQKLLKMAAQLGSDCPFFIGDTPALATGTGDRLEPLALALSKVHLVVITPPIHVNTGKAYGMLNPKAPESDLMQALSGNISTWKEAVTNDFEEPLFEKHGEIAKVKEILMNKGAIYASLSGSGSSVYGIFEEAPEPSGWFGEEHRLWAQTL